MVERLDRIWPDLTAEITRPLIALRKQFEGDLDAVLILGPVSIAKSGEDWQEILLGKAHGSDSARSATNTRCISHVIAVPREKVRRKLAWPERT